VERKKTSRQIFVYYLLYSTQISKKRELEAIASQTTQYGLAVATLVAYR
jgi:hypothetical protein